MIFRLGGSPLIESLRCLDLPDISFHSYSDYDYLAYFKYHVFVFSIQRANSEKLNNMRILLEGFYSSFLHYIALLTKF